MSMRGVDRGDDRTVPPFATAHTFRAFRDGYGKL